jgi:hypothetical protein
MHEPVASVPGVERGDGALKTIHSNADFSKSVRLRAAAW